MRPFRVLVTATAALLLLTSPAIALAANDDLAGATTVTALPFSDSLDTSGATVETDEPTGDGFCPPRNATVWYALTLDSTQTVSIDTAGSGYDTTLAVYTGSGFGDLALVDCIDDTFFGAQAALTLDVEGGTTYLIQVGSFGDNPGGPLEISIAEPGRTNGKPVIFKNNFKGLFADASIQEFDETTGTFSYTGAGIVDGQSQQTGKPSKFSSLFVSSFTETFDEDLGTYTYTEWFGFAELSRDEFSIDRRLRNARVATDLTLQGQTCTGSFDEEGETFECTDLGTINVTADLTWMGVGGVQRSQYRESSTFDGFRLMFRGSFSSRQANVSGGLTGDVSIDFTGAYGSLGNQTSGDFVMIRGSALP